MDPCDLYDTRKCGHGTEYGFDIPTIESPKDAEAWVDARIREGSDYIKVFLEDGFCIGHPLPMLDSSSLDALVATAGELGLKTIAHAWTQESVAANAREIHRVASEGANKSGALRPKVVRVKATRSSN